MIPQINLTRAQLENQVKLQRAKVELQRAVVLSGVQETATYARLVTEAVRTLLEHDEGTRDLLHRLGDPPWLKEWLAAHEAKSKALEEVGRMLLAEMEAQLKVFEAMLDSPKIVRGGLGG